MNAMRVEHPTLPSHRAGTMAKPATAHVIAAMPAYNEERYIGTVVLKARQYADEVLVLDDGSTDHTADVARLAGATVLRHASRAGKGAAVQTIWNSLRGRNFDVLILLDADSQHNPDEIPYLVEAVLKGCDLVIGSRKAEARNTPRYRRIGQAILLLFAKYLSRSDITDSESGFRGFSSRAVKEMQLTERGFAIEVEMIAKAADRGLKVGEVAISNVYTGDGSKWNPWAHGLGVLIRILVMISERRPLAVFGLAGAILIAAGLAAGGVIVLAESLPALAYNGLRLLSVLLLAFGSASVFTGIILNSLARR